MTKGSKTSHSSPDHGHEHGSHSREAKCDNPLRSLQAAHERHVGHIKEVTHAKTLQEKLRNSFHISRGGGYYGGDMGGYGYYSGGEYPGYTMTTPEPADMSYLEMSAASQAQRELRHLQLKQKPDVVSPKAKIVVEKPEIQKDYTEQKKCWEDLKSGKKTLEQIIKDSYLNKGLYIALE